MKPLLLAFAAAVAAGVVYGGVTIGSVNAKAPEYFASLAEKADGVTIEFYGKNGPVSVTFSDREWLKSLAQNLRLATYVSRDPCLCISYPRIHVQSGEATILTLSIHHGNRLRAASAEISDDFFVGEDVGRWISDLAEEKRPANKSLEGTPFTPPEIRVDPSKVDVPSGVPQL